MRDKSNAYLHECQDLNKAGKLSMLIDLLTCAPPKDLDLQKIPCPIAGQITYYYEIQRLVHAHLYRWHAIPKNLAGSCSGEASQGSGMV
jgi:hypothetical protein